MTPSWPIDFTTLHRSTRVMGLRLVCLVGFLVTAVPTLTQAQLSSGLLDPSRAVDWSSAGVTGGIPVRTTICATLNPGATAAQISSAISACPSGQVVFLNAGTYTLSSAISLSKNNVTLRGAGADQTILVTTGNDSGCGIGFVGFAIRVCTSNGTNIANGGGTAKNTAAWSAGYAKGTATVTLSSTINLVVGSTIFLDQLNDAVTDGVTDGFPGPGDILQCESTQPCSG